MEHPNVPGVADRYSEDRGFGTWQGIENFLFSKPFSSDLGYTQPPVQLLQGALSQGANRSPQHTAQFKNDRYCNSTTRWVCKENLCFYIPILTYAKMTIWWDTKIENRTFTIIAILFLETKSTSVATAKFANL
jgi:hypothetical protein